MRMKMKNLRMNRKYLYLILFLVLAVALMITEGKAITLTYTRDIEYKNAHISNNCVEHGDDEPSLSEEEEYSTENVQFLTKNIKERFLKKSLTTCPVKYTLPIVGYALKAESAVSIEHDDFGLFRIDIKNNDEATITLMVKSGSFTFKKIPITGKFDVDKIGKIACYYELDRPQSGFFMKIITDPEITYIEIACDTNESQLCYQNVIQNKECDFKPFYVKNSLINFYNHVLDRKRFEKQSFSEMRSTLISNLKNGVKVCQNPQWKEQKKSLDTRSSITTTDYVISFEAEGLAGVPGFTFAEDMVEWDHYVSALTEIDIGIYRANPTESEVKSDLSYYNKDYIVGGNGYRRNIKAYAPYAHEGSTIGQSWYIRKYGWWIFQKYEYLFYTEVQDLWYHWENPIEGVYIDVSPYDMIVLASVCWGYADSPSGYPYMPKAFVDHGALSYVGCTDYLLSGDIPDDAFWSRLCIWDESVYAATLNYVASMPWYIYGTDIKIYGGTTSAYLDN